MACSAVYHDRKRFLMKKNTLFFWFGAVAVVLMVAMLIFYVVQYNATLESYIDYYGYTDAEMQDYMPFLATVVPDYLPAFMGLGLIAAVLFATNSILKALPRVFKAESAPVLPKTVPDTVSEKTPEA